MGKKSKELLNSGEQWKKELLDGVFRQWENGEELLIMVGNGEMV
jgi:hypothetical protein